MGPPARDPVEQTEEAMKYRAVLAATTFLLVACDQPTPTEPTLTPSRESPQFQGGQEQVSVSLSRAAELDNDIFIWVNGSFTCPEGQTAFFSVTVVQSRPNGTTIGSGGGSEACRFGSNKWRVHVFSGSGFDIGPAVATVSMTSPAGSASDNGQISIR
jgi:hypothetical protein